MKLVIELDGTEHTLEMKDAKELYETLKQIFDKKKEVEYIPVAVPYYPPKPWWQGNYYEWIIPCTITAPNTQISKDVWTSSGGNVSMKLVS